VIKQHVIEKSECIPVNTLKDEAEHWIKVVSIPDLLKEKLESSRYKLSDYVSQNPLLQSPSQSLPLPSPSITTSAFPLSLPITMAYSSLPPSAPASSHNIPR